MTNTIDPSRELTMTRIFCAPRHLVLKMWSDPAILTQWWGPFGFSTTTHSMDFRPGGIWKFTMHGPDGTDYPNVIRYVAVGPDRIAYEHGSNDLHVDGFMVEVSLEDFEEGKTKMNFRMIFPTPEERTRIVDTYGADKGLVQTLTRLDLLVADKQAREHPFKMHLSLPSETEMRMVRSFKAPKEAVFEAFTNAELIRKWQAPHKYTFSECQYDARPGGKWMMAQVDDEGHEYRFFGDILSIEPPVRIESTFEFEGFPGAVQSNITTFEEVDGLTRVTIVSSYPNKEERDQMLESGMEWGMNQSYERLEELLAQ